jgi:cytochrome c-type biogenesis protein CcmH/NrfF
MSILQNVFARGPRADRHGASIFALRLTIAALALGSALAVGSAALAVAHGRRGAGVGDNPCGRTPHDGAGAELRCLQCQNQTLADSEAPLAVDLRQEIRELIAKGQTDEQIKAYLVARYGDFVLYRPPGQEQDAGAVVRSGRGPGRRPAGAVPGAAAAQCAPRSWRPRATPLAAGLSAAEARRAQKLLAYGRRGRPRS